jgi:Mrp family chromosome partitioning ATPase
MDAPAEQANALASTAPVPQATPPVAPLFGSRPPPGAGSYSVSSSHPPPVDNTRGVTRTSVEKLSPLQSAHPPAQAVVSRRASPIDPPILEPGLTPQIMSRPPALDPEAEAWAARFETPPPPPPDPADVVTEEPVLDQQRRKRSGRWKTQVMGSMVPLEVAAAREERAPYSEDAESFRIEPAPVPERQAAAPVASTVIHHDVPAGWRPNVDPTTPAVISLRDAVLKQVSVRRLNIAVTGARGASRAHVAGSLALALAHSGARVLLVEGDFDNPDVHLALGLSAPHGAGFSQQLVARRHDPKPRPWVVVRCSPTLQVLAEGRMRSPGSLAAEEFERAMSELREQHHVVLIHAPPLDNPADLRPIGGVAQAVVVAAADYSASIQFGDNVLGAML